MSDRHTPLISRRRRLAAASVLTLGALVGCAAHEPPPAEVDEERHSSTFADFKEMWAEPGDLATEGLAALEERYRARLGVFAVDTGSGKTVEFRADERFAFASTYKAIAAAAVLDRTTPGQLARVVRYDASDLVPYSPVTERHVGSGLTLSQIAEAAVRHSDNTAGNLLFDALGGPRGFERALRALGDDVTVATREETSLNETAPGDPRDTSTPRAFATVLRTYAVDDALTPADRRLLMGWMRGNATGASLIEAGLPHGWRVVDKSGAAAFGTRNDIAVVRPPGRAPIVLTVFSDRRHRAATYDDALIARATQVVIRHLVSGAAPRGTGANPAEPTSPVN